MSKLVLLTLCLLFGVTHSWSFQVIILSSKHLLTLFTDPLNFVILVWFIPMIAAMLFVVQLTLMTLEYIKPIKDILASISTRHGGGLSMANWYLKQYSSRLLIEGMIRKCSIDINQTSQEPRKSWEVHVNLYLIGRGSRSGEMTRAGGAGGSMFAENLPVFDVDLAFTLLQMSAIIYERLTTPYLVSR
jgi:hypothetical protein